MTPKGQAMAEALVATTVLLALWILAERSEFGLAHALRHMFSRYGFSLSIPW